MSNQIGSGLDVNAIVDGLMKLKQKALLKLDNKKEILHNQQTAYNTLRDMFKNFSGTVEDLNSVLNANLFKIQSSNESVVSAVANSQNAAQGNYSIVTNQLAQAHQISSSIFGSENQALQTQGTLSITTGGNSFNLVINQTDTLDSIRDNINNSFNNPGISASILKTTNSSGADDFRLILSSNKTGVANQMLLSGDALTSLNLNNTLQAAQDAKFTIDGFSVTRSSNLITDVLNGVSLQLNSASGSANISIASDTSNEQAHTKDSLQKMVDSYNKLVDYLSTNQSNSSLKDNTYSIIKLNLKNTMAQTLGTSSINSLLSLGIALAPSQTKSNANGVEYVVEGKLTINNDLLNTALETNQTALRSFFTDFGKGFIYSLDSSLNSIETKNIFSREQSIAQEASSIDQKINREESRLDQIKVNLTIKYANLDTYLSKYRQISDFLDQQLSMMNSSRK